MKWVLYLAVIALVVFHQDFWNWPKAHPLLFGFLPIGLWYHALFCIAASMLLALFVAVMWPRHLEAAEHDGPPTGH